MPEPAVAEGIRLLARTVVALESVTVKRPGWPVAVQLVRREGRRMIRHPVMWGGALLSLALFGLFTWHSAPVLHRDDASVAGSLLPLAAAALIVANLAASRAARNATEELYEATSSSTGLRTFAHLLALGHAAGLAVALVAAMFAFMLADAPVGTPNAAEVATGPVVVVLFGAVGVALARWRPHPALGPLAVVVAVAVQILLVQPIVDDVATTSTVVTRLPWLAPWVPLSLTGDVPPELVIRPAAWHVLYLAGLTAVVAAFALARSGWRARLVPVFVAGAVAVALGTIGQLTPSSGSQRAQLASLIEHPEDHQVCEERRGVTYCAYPAYTAWIDRWAAPIEGALDGIPAGARPDNIVVRQTFGSYFEGPVDLPQATLRRAMRAEHRASRDQEPGTTIRTGTRWGRGRTEGGYAIGLALTVAMEAVGLPSSRAEMVPTEDEIAEFKTSVLPTLDERFRAKAEQAWRPGRRLYSCTTLHQARAMAALWIAGQATPATRATVTRSAAESSYGLQIYDAQGKRYAAYVGSFMPLYPEVPPPMWDRVSMGDVEFHYAARLLSRPDDEVGAVFAQRWDELTEPTTLTESFLDDLGLAPHVTIEEQIARLPDDVELERGRRNWTPDAFFAQTIPCF
ncbi:MAG TPA: hypothetical protein VG929_02040 [Actinomycetota bacterium]|nr:hypothetical protein [Actinomycetota bacterium]